MRRLLLLLLIFTTNSLFSEGLVKVNINDFIDNQLISSFTETENGLYVVIQSEVYKLDIIQKKLDSVYNLDPGFTTKNRIISVNYFDHKFFVNTFNNGTILLDTNFDKIRGFTMENSKLRYATTNKTLKGFNNEIFILNDAHGILKIADSTEYYDYYSFLGTDQVYDMYAYNGKYYFALSGVASLITDDKFNILDTINLTQLAGFEHNRCEKVFAFDKYVIWGNQWDGLVLYNSENKTYKLMTTKTSKIQSNHAINFMYDNQKLFICNVEGLYIYNPETGEEKAYRITKEPTDGVSGSPNTIFDIVKIEGTYYVTTRNGIYYLDETQSGLIKLETSNNQLYSINSNTFVCNNSLTLEIFDLNSKLIYDGNFNEGNTLNLRDILKANTVYFIKVTNDNKTESSKFILSDI